MESKETTGSAAKSSQMTGRKILGVISKRRAERLLEDWANTREGGVARLLKIHAQEIDIPRSEFKQLVETRVEGAGRVVARSFREKEYSVRRIAEFLRKAWDTPDLRRFDWYLWKAVSIAQSHAWLFDFIDDPPDHATAVEAAIFHLRHNRRRARHCSNPDCSAPYFFQQKKRQKFCSTPCALPSQRESKHRWWLENRTKKKARRK